MDAATLDAVSQLGFDALPAPRPTMLSVQLLSINFNVNAIEMNTKNVSGNPFKSQSRCKANKSERHSTQLAFHGE